MFYIRSFSCLQVDILHPSYLKRNAFPKQSIKLSTSVVRVTKLVLENLGSNPKKNHDHWTHTTSLNFFNETKKDEKRWCEFSVPGYLLDSNHGSLKTKIVTLTTAVLSLIAWGWHFLQSVMDLPITAVLVAISQEINFVLF